MTNTVILALSALAVVALVAYSIGRDRLATLSLSAILVAAVTLALSSAPIVAAPALVAAATPAADMIDSYDVPETLTPAGDVVPDRFAACLMAMGAYGDPSDGAERLYFPRPVGEACQTLTLMAGPLA